MMGREAVLEFCANAPPGEGVSAPQLNNGLILAVYDEAGQPVFQHLRHRTVLECNDRGAAGHRLDHHQSERLAPPDREKQRRRISQKFLLLILAGLTDKL